MRLDADSLERIIPDELRVGEKTGEETLRLSVERYEFASAQLSSGNVLDMACGVGYGTRLLTDRVAGIHATGVDISSAAIEYADRRYANERTRFRAADAMAFDAGAPYDAIVSIETIEHLPEPQRFIDRLVPLLSPGGLLIGSVPVTPSVDANPHHLHDFSERSFRQLFTRHGLRAGDELRQDQPFAPVAVLRRDEARMKDVRPNLIGYYIAHPDALIRRAWSTLRHGFVSKYLTVAWRKPA